MTQIFFIGYHGIYSEISCWGDYSRIFAEATCSVVADTPWDWTKRFNRDSIKNLCISVKSVGQKNSHEKNLRHLRNLRDKKRPPKNHEAKSPKKNLWDKRTTRRRTKTTISSWFSNEYRNRATVLAPRLTLKDDPNLRMLPVSSPTWRANQHDWWDNPDWRYPEQ